MPVSAIKVRPHPLNRRMKPGPRSQSVDRGEEMLTRSAEVLDLVARGELEPNRDFSKRVRKSRQDDLKLAAEIQTYGSIEARNAIVKANAGLIWIVISKSFAWMPKHKKPELFQQGQLGLLRATQDFNPSLGWAFGTYAVYWIRASIQRFVEGNDKAEFAGKDEKGDPIRVSSLEAMVREDEDPFDIVDETKTPADQQYEEETMKSKVRQVFADVQVELHNDPRVAVLINERILAEVPKALPEIGARFGVSRERMRQIESKVMDRARARLQEINEEFVARGEV